MSGNKRNSCLSDIIETPPKKKTKRSCCGKPTRRQTESTNLKYSSKNQISKWFISNVWRIGPQVWFQNARAKFRRNLLRQDNTGVDKASDGSTLPGGTPSGPASEISNASMSPSSTPTTLTDLTNPTMPTVTSVLTSVPGSLDIHECRSPSQSTLTSLFWYSDCTAPSSASSIRGAT